MKLLCFGHLDRVTNLGINMYFSILFICFLFVFFLSGESCNDQWENLQGKWPTVSSPFTTFTACLSMVLLNSHLATSFSLNDDLNRS